MFRRLVDNCIECSCLSKWYSRSNAELSVRSIRLKHGGPFCVKYIAGKLCFPVFLLRDCTDVILKIILNKCGGPSVTDT